MKNVPNRTKNVQGNKKCASVAHYIHYGIKLPCLACKALYGLVWPCMALYGLKRHCMVFYRRISSFLAVMDPNSFGLVLPSRGLVVLLKDQ